MCYIHRKSLHSLLTHRSSPNCYPPVHYAGCFASLFIIPEPNYFYNKFLFPELVQIKIFNLKTRFVPLLDLEMEKLRISYRWAEAAGNGETYYLVFPIVSDTFPVTETRYLKPQFKAGEVYSGSLLKVSVLEWWATWWKGLVKAKLVASWCQKSESREESGKEISPCPWWLPSPDQTPLPESKSAILPPYYNHLAKASLMSAWVSWKMSK